MRVGILTYHSAKNYGAILQCFALQNVLSRNDEFDVKVINYTPNVFNSYFPNPKKLWEIKSNKIKLYYFLKWILRKEQTEKESRKYEKLSSFINSKLLLTRELQKEDLPKLNDEFDVFVTGSDQVWNFEMIDRDTAFLLDFTGKKKISYAASTKLSALTDRDVYLLKKYLPSFSHVSVREEDVCKYLNDIGIYSKCDIDPTMLLERSDWEKLIENTSTELSNFVLIYYVNAPEKLVEKAIEYADKKGLRVVSLNRLKTSYDYFDFSDASIEEFVWLIKNAKCVFTTSFHGLVFSIIFNTYFFFETPEHSRNNNQRLLSLAKKLDVKGQSLQENDYCELNICWEKVNIKVQQLREKSIYRLYRYINN